MKNIIFSIIVAILAPLWIAANLNAQGLSILKEVEVEITQGTGRIVSNPDGIDCTRSENFVMGDCHALFASNEPVALMAIPISGQSYTSSFVSWDGDCQGQIEACALLPATTNSLVKASFGAVGDVAFALPEPGSKELFSYHPVTEPMLDPDPSRCRPLAVGEYEDGLSLKIHLPAITPGPVDIYVGISAFYSIDTYFVCPDLSLQPDTHGAVPWKTDIHSTEVDEALYGTIPMSGFPLGAYNLFLWVKPHGKEDPYYLWHTYFAGLS